MESQYLQIMRNTLEFGELQKNRTGIDTLMYPGGDTMLFNLNEGFPAVTTKKLAFNAVKGELIGFLRGYTSAADFRKLGCRIWDQNANENKDWLANPNRFGEDDLGRIYSAQYTDWSTEDGYGLNQIQKLVDDIKSNPTSRRLIVSAWRPDEFDQMALPPCHILYQVTISQETGFMDLFWYQRSNDLFLGIPFNIASYSLLLNILCRLTGYKPRFVRWFGADVHIYANHIDAVKEQLSRDPLPLPTLKISEEFTPDTPIHKIKPEWFELENYQSHPPILAPMAV